MAFAYSPKIVTDGLVLYLDAANPYSYVSGSTVWRDISKTMTSGSLINGPTFSSANNGSIVFDGVDDYVSIPDINFTTTTIDIWVNLNAYGGIGTVFTYQTGNGFEIWSNTSGVIRFNKNSGINLTLGSGFTLNSWNNIVATSDGSINRLYLNNVNIGSNAGGIVDNTSGDIRISSYTNYLFNGRCPLFKIYNRALTAQEVQQNYNATKGRFGLT